MKKILAILLVAAMLMTFCAFAEEDTTAEQIDAVDITSDGTKDESEPEAGADEEPEAAADEEPDALTEEFPGALADEEPEAITDKEPEEDLEEASGSVTLGFEEGFAIELPAGWLHYTITEEMAVDGVVYCLSDAAGQCWLYIQKWQSDCTDADALLELVNNTAAPINSGKYNFNGSDFVVYDLETSDVSCCATLMDGNILNFVFTPQSNADFMVTAAQVIGTYTVL